MPSLFTKRFGEGESGFKTDSDKVYTQDSTNTKDANGNFKMLFGDFSKVEIGDEIDY